MFKTIRLVGFPLRIQKKLKGYSGFLQPDDGSWERSERNNCYPGIEPFDNFTALAQLCHVLPAGQSAKVAQENQ